MRITIEAIAFTLAGLIAAPACSLRTANQVACTEDVECVAAFGAGAVCRSDGFCAAGTTGDGGLDAGDDGDPGVAPWTFVSFPDFLNADVGDVSALTGEVNSTNQDHEAAIDTVLDALAAEQPDFVLVAGDLVNGHWYLDASGVQVFGPVATRAQKAAAVDRGADLYYTQWKARFAARGLPVYAAVGDHDIGDNNWGAGSDKAHLVPTYKQAFARHFTRDEDGNPRFPRRPVGTAYEHTAYAVRHKNVLIVTVDVFRQDDPTVAIDPKTGSVRTEVIGEQLAWLQAELESAAADPEIDHVIVQGHVPVLVPVRQQNSSGLTMPGAASSAFWQALAAHDVDLYFAGEVHDMTAANADGVEQVVHGGILGYARSVSYLVGHVYPDRIELELRRAELVYPAGDSSRLWQAGSNRPRAHYAIGPAGFEPAGTLVIDKSSDATQYLNRTGYFIHLGGAAEGLAVHLPFDEPAGSSTAVNHGTTGAANNGAVSGASFVGGKLGNAVAFDALDRIVAGPPPVVADGARTTSVWVRVDPTPGVIRTVFTFGRNMAGGKWDVDIDGAGLFELGVAMGRTDATGTPSVTDGAWHHLVTVLPAGASTLGAVRMYIDGQPITFKAAQMSVDTRPGGNLIVGHAANSTNFQQYSGLIDDLAIWAEALTPAQVRALTSFANETALHYDAGEVQALFAGFAAGQDVQISGRLWRYQGNGLGGTPGEVVASGDGYVINLGGGAGFVTP